MPPKSRPKLERHRNLTFNEWLTEVCPHLGYLPKADGVSIETHMVSELGVSRGELRAAWKADMPSERFSEENPRYVSKHPQHNHTMGTSRCGRCILESKLPREGGVPWLTWCQGLLKILDPKDVLCTSHAAVRIQLSNLGVDEKDATEHWSRNFTPEGYIRLKGLKPRVDRWDGMAPCGKHGADYKGQPCNLCGGPLPDARVEVVLTTAEVAERIEKWAQACKTSSLDGKKVKCVRDLIYLVQEEVEGWIETLEDAD